MPRLTAGLALQLEISTDSALALATAGEIIRSNLVPASIAYKELTIARLEALYELAYLRIFLTWEAFLEESFLRYLCGFHNSAGPVALKVGRFSTIDDARVAVLAGSRFVSWYNPVSVVRRAQRFCINSPHELVVVSVQTQLEWYAAIRGRIAHASTYARGEFDQATLGLAGRRIRGSRPGSFLRTIDHGAGKRWLHVLADGFKGLAGQITP